MNAAANGTNVCIVTTLTNANAWNDELQGKIRSCMSEGEGCMQDVARCLTQYQQQLSNQQQHQNNLKRVIQQSIHADGESLQSPSSPPPNSSFFPFSHLNLSNLHDFLSHCVQLERSIRALPLLTQQYPKNVAPNGDARLPFVMHHSASNSFQLKSSTRFLLQFLPQLPSLLALLCEGFEPNHASDDLPADAPFTCIQIIIHDPRVVDVVLQTFDALYVDGVNESSTRVIIPPTTNSMPMPSPYQSTPASSNRVAAVTQIKRLDSEKTMRWVESCMLGIDQMLSYFLFQESNLVVSRVQLVPTGFSDTSSSFAHVQRISRYIRELRMKLGAIGHSQANQSSFSPIVTKLCELLSDEFKSYELINQTLTALHLNHTHFMPLSQLFFSKLLTIGAFLEVQTLNEKSADVSFPAPYVTILNAVGSHLCQHASAYESSFCGSPHASLPKSDRQPRLEIQLLRSITGPISAIWRHLSLPLQFQLMDQFDLNSIIEDRIAEYLDQCIDHNNTPLQPEEVERARMKLAGISTKNQSINGIARESHSFHLFSPFVRFGVPREIILNLDAKESDRVVLTPSQIDHAASNPQYFHMLQSVFELCVRTQHPACLELLHWLTCAIISRDAEAARQMILMLYPPDLHDFIDQLISSFHYSDFPSLIVRISETILRLLQTKCNQVEANDMSDFSSAADSDSNSWSIEWQTRVKPDGQLESALLFQPHESNATDAANNPTNICLHVWILLRQFHHVYQFAFFLLTQPRTTQQQLHPSLFSAILSIIAVYHCPIIDYQRARFERCLHQLVAVANSAEPKAEAVILLQQLHQEATTTTSSNPSELPAHLLRRIAILLLPSLEHDLQHPLASLLIPAASKAAASVLPHSGETEVDNHHQLSQAVFDWIDGAIVAWLTLRHGSSSSACQLSFDSARKLASAVNQYCMPHQTLDSNVRASIKTINQIQHQHLKILFELQQTSISNVSV